MNGEVFLYICIVIMILQGVLLGIFGLTWNGEFNASFVLRFALWVISLGAFGYIVYYMIWR
ncbi:hypothetical protein BK722_04425 [Bacillus thuringiensis serovar finitimus]|nr:hypothetical protein YBT020_28986 [Bacillus thuringiensis serovar finitimus YBT-020]OTX75819.1 hypothetical protein BK722_04425 [Bacillus thuringiensis serovar finitimus]OTY30220.1 hypothetical protein BK736_27075 [Bacillus thuringiensis serovar poloniensis]